LALTERYWGKQPIGWHGAAAAQASSKIDDRLLDSAALLMLRDFAASQDHAVLGEFSRQSTGVARAGLLLRKLFPSHAAMATMYPVQPHSPRVLLWYPVRWYRLLCGRLPRYWRNRRQDRFRLEAGQLAELRHWLARP